MLPAPALYPCLCVHADHGPGAFCFHVWGRQWSKYSSWSSMAGNAQGNIEGLRAPFFICDTTDFQSLNLPSLLVRKECINRSCRRESEKDLHMITVVSKRYFFHIYVYPTLRMDVTYIFNVKLKCTHFFSWRRNKQASTNNTMEALAYVL